MHRARTAGPGAGRSWTDSRAGYHGHAGLNRSLIDGPAGDRRALRPQRHAGTRRDWRRAHHGRPWLTQFRHQIRTRWNHGPRGWLTGEAWPGLRAGGGPGRGHGCRRVSGRCLGPWRCGPRRRDGGSRQTGARARRTYALSGAAWKRLPGSGKHLARPGSRRQRFGRRRDRACDGRGVRAWRRLRRWWWRRTRWRFRHGDHRRRTRRLLYHRRCLSRQWRPDREGRARRRFCLGLFLDRRDCLYHLDRRWRRRSHLRFDDWCGCRSVHHGSFRFLPHLGFGWPFRRAQGLVAERDPQFIRDVIVDRTGMGLLIVHAEFGKFVEDFVRFHLELPCQLVNPNLLHSETIASSAGLPACLDRPQGPSYFSV